MSPVRFALFLVTALTVLSTPAAHAQTAVSGRAVDAETGEGLPGAHVVATRLAPDSLLTGAAADADGRFRLRVPTGPHRLRVSFAGYAPDVRTLDVPPGEALALGDVRLRPAELGEIAVEALRERVTLRGDTTVFHAGAFRVNPDASAEDLVRKMPGITVQDGEVQAQGEAVRRVLVDGEEFFGSDPTAALRNLPAEVIQEVQVLDRESDQARFTGFDDGNAERTINIVTRPDRRQGQFGRLFGGVGGEWDAARYASGGTAHVFDGARRISVIGIANNVNEQNFASEDLLGVLSASSEGGGRRGGRGGGPPRGGGPRGGDARNFLVGERGGVTATAALGVNYADRWGEALRVSGSYFLNRAGNDTEARSERDYFAADGLRYGEATDATSTDWNHRFSGRLEARLSDATELTLTPRLSVQSTASESLVSAQTAVRDALSAFSRNDQRAAASGFTSSADLLLRHRFPADGRTLSLGLEAGLDGRDGETEQDVLAMGYAGARADTTDAYRRRTGSESGGRALAARLVYTEPLGARAQLQLAYAPALSTSAADQGAFRFDPATGAFTAADSAFTSDSERRVTTQRGGVGVRYRAERLRLSAGLDVQHERLAFEQGGPRAFAVDRAAAALLPSASARVELTEAVNLDLRYRSSTASPSVRQLGDFVDDTNPLLVTAGNPDLRTSRSHDVSLRLRATRPEAGSVLFGALSLAVVQDYVGTAVTAAGAEPVTVGGVTLPPGAQLSSPVNLDGYVRARAFGVAGRPIGFLRSNASANLGVTYTRTPSLYNGARNRADAVAVDGRVFLGTSFSERFDASLGYGLGWTSVANDTRASRDDAYLRHRVDAHLTWLPWRGLTLHSDLRLSAYTGLDADLDPTAALWNAGVGYKFLRGDLAEVRLSVNDLLNASAAPAQTVTDTYVETSQSQALGRYVMLTLSYQLRAFGG